MALDSTFSLANAPPATEPVTSLREIPELATEIERNANRMWATQVSKDGCHSLDGRAFAGRSGPQERLFRLLRGRWLVLDHVSLDTLDAAIKSFQRHGGNGYKLLLAARTIVVAPSPQAHLAGGSYASARLVPSVDGVAVRKVIDCGGRFSDIDGGLRLAREAKWLGELSAEATRLFPPMLSFILTASTVGYVSAFLPGYTFAEQLFTGAVSAAEARDILVDVLAALKTHVYRIPLQCTTGAYAEDDYIDRIRRRTAVILATKSDAGRVFHRLIHAPTVMVNGVTCASLPVLLQRLNRRTINQHIRVGTPERARGDLILDDVVLMPDRTARLLDPNGGTRTRLYDLGKLCLSLLTCYEFFKYDKFECRLDVQRRVPEISIEIQSGTAPTAYRQLAELLPSILSDAELLGGTNHAITGTGLLLLNGLQNAALPVFHLLRDGNVQRAAAFYAIGLLRITEALTWLDRRKSPSLGDVCTCLF